MGYERALKAINLEETARIPCAELIANPYFEKFVTGIDLYQHPLKARLKLIEILDLDLMWGSQVVLSDKPIKRLFTMGESTLINKEGDLVVKWGAGTTGKVELGRRIHRN